MERVCAQWVPRILTDENRMNRVVASQAFLRKWRSEGERFLDRIITTDWDMVVLLWLGNETAVQPVGYEGSGSARENQSRQVGR